MASFSDKPKIPLLGNGGSETHASLGTWKAQMSSTLVRHGCGVFASMDPSKMPDTYPSKPKQGQGAAAQQRYEELVEMFEGKFNIKDKVAARGQVAACLCSSSRGGIQEPKTVRAY